MFAGLSDIIAVSAAGVSVMVSALAESVSTSRGRRWVSRMVVTLKR